MRDLPMFTTSKGVASLTLREIPYKKTAYIKIQDTLDPEDFLKECCDFCIAVGAQQVFASGHAVFGSYPFYTSILKMCCLRETLPDTDAALFPVQMQNLEQWRTLYNEKMQSVHNARYMTLTDAQELLAKGNGYFVHRDNMLLGIGIASGDTIDAVAAAFPGAGKDVLLALNHALYGEQIIVTVASENQRAIRFYEKLGFIQTEVLETWHQIF